VILAVHGKVPPLALPTPPGLAGVENHVMNFQKRKGVTVPSDSGQSHILGLLVFYKETTPNHFLDCPQHEIRHGTSQPFQTMLPF